MSYRCTNPFLYGEKLFAGGALVPDDHPILETHAAHFAKVEEAFAGSETATQGPGEVHTPTSAADTEAADTAEWLAAEAQYNADVESWLSAEAQYETDVVAWLIAEGEAANEHETSDAPEPVEKPARTRAPRASK